MKFLKFLGVIALVFSLTLCFTSCGNSGDSTGEEAKTEVKHGEGKAYTSAYVCPMHCEGSGSEEAGTCPVCGMAYVAQADHTNDGHKH